MTDLNDRFAAMLENEPPAPHDIDRVVAGGRRAQRRRSTLVAVAGTAGTAAITAAVVVPITTANHHGTTDAITVRAKPTPSKLAQVRCEYYLHKGAGKADLHHQLDLVRRKADRHGVSGTSITTHRMKRGDTVILVCPPGAKPYDPTKPYHGGAGDTPTRTVAPPSYRYTADPQTIANGFAAELDKQVKKLGFTIVYSRPFAQESSTLEKGHPSYYDGNVDVQLPDGPADIGVQITHEVVELVPFDGKCDPATCTRSTLADGSLMQVSHIDAGSGAAEVVVVEVRHANGVVVQAQMSNYAFGPEATKDRTASQPLTIAQLTELAKSPAWTF
jgi:hypothetical protein